MPVAWILLALLVLPAVTSPTGSGCGGPSQSSEKSCTTISASPGGGGGVNTKGCAGAWPAAGTRARSSDLGVCTSIRLRGGGGVCSGGCWLLPLGPVGVCGLLAPASDRRPRSEAAMELGHGSCCGDGVLIITIIICYIIIIITIIIIIIITTYYYYLLFLLLCLLL